MLLLLLLLLWGFADDVLPAAAADHYDHIFRFILALDELKTDTYKEYCVYPS